MARNSRKNNCPACTSARYISWQVLVTLEKQRFRQHADDELHAACDRAGVEPRERRLAYTIVSGVLSNKTLLEHYIIRYANRTLETIEPELRWLLAIALYQLIFLDRTADYAAVNEAAMISKQARKPAWTGFINGLLRAYLRDVPERPRRPETGLPLPLRYSHPEWLVKRWITSYGERETEQILDWNNRHPEQYARARCAIINAVEVLGPGLVSPASEYGTEALRILKTSEVIKSKAFNEGILYLMQPWSMNVIRQLPVEDGWQVLDMCAAPGGKCIALADRADIHVMAADISEERVIRLKENIARCRVDDRITVKVLDSRNCTAELGENQFDAVLLDAPCSNLGVVQRNPEVRWRICPDDIMTLASLQRDLLTDAAGTVKPGGYILYAVCTITREETEEVVACVLQRTHGLECVSSSRNLPGQNGMDGGYWALMRKTGRRDKG